MASINKKHGCKTVTFRTPKKYPWRPVLGYETVEVMPIPTQPITNNSMRPCFVPEGMITLPLLFPNYITGFERNPLYAATAALENRYWGSASKDQIHRLYAESDANRSYTERLRNDTVVAMRETDEKIVKGQKESGVKIGERLTEISFWKDEASRELEKLITENELLQDSRRSLEKAIADTEGPLHIAQQCLALREAREGNDLCHDEVEASLIKEIETYRNCQVELNAFINKIGDQSRNARAFQQHLELDVQSKMGAYDIDEQSHKLTNYSSGLQYYGGIEKFDPTVTNQQSWAEQTNNVIFKSQNERQKTGQMRADIELVINNVFDKIWTAWNNTNHAFSRKVAEDVEVKEKIQWHLKRIQQEHFEADKYIELLNKAIKDKEFPLKVAHTRLEGRCHRKGLELCKDIAQDNLLTEVVNVQDSIDLLNKKLEAVHAQRQQLLKIFHTLDERLRHKITAIFIDREKCLGIRRTFPIAATIRYHKNATK